MGQAFPDPRIDRGDRLVCHRRRLYSHDRPQVGGCADANTDTHSHTYIHTYANSYPGAAHGYGHSYANQHPNPDSFAHTHACAAYPNTHSQHMGRAQHVQMGPGGTRGGYARGDGDNAAADHGQQRGS